MRKIMILTVTALAGIAFAGAAQAGVGCDGSKVVETSKPIVTAASGTTMPQLPIATPTENKGG